MEPNGTGAEAPASWNIRYTTADGFACQLTLRGASGADVLTRAIAAVKWLVEHDATADGYRPAPAAAPAEPATDPSWCAIHQAKMKIHSANGESWYSHKVGDEWCKGKTK